jgi:hypothetical protein
LSLRRVRGRIRLRLSGRGRGTALNHGTRKPADDYRTGYPT